jgi:hypothetical protein
LTSPTKPSARAAATQASKRERADAREQPRHLRRREAEAAHAGVDLDVDVGPPPPPLGGGREPLEIAELVHDGREPVCQDVRVAIVVVGAENDDGRAHTGRAQLHTLFDQ